MAFSFGNPPGKIDALAGAMDRKVLVTIKDVDFL